MLRSVRLPVLSVPYLKLSNVQFTIRYGCCGTLIGNAVLEVVLAGQRCRSVTLEQSHSRRRLKILRGN